MALKLAGSFSARFSGHGDACKCDIVFSCSWACHQGEYLIDGLVTETKNCACGDGVDTGWDMRYGILYIRESWKRVELQGWEVFMYVLE